MTRLSKHIKLLEEYSIRLDQSHRDGKFIAGTKTLSNICEDLAKAFKEIEKSI